MARRRTSPYGHTREGFRWDTQLQQFINIRTGEIVDDEDAGKALLMHDYEVRRFASKEGYAKRWIPERDDWLIHPSHALRMIRQELRRVDPDEFVNLRGLGGSVKYPDEWWTTQARSAEDLLAMDDEELAQWCYQLDNPAYMVEVAIAED